MSASLDIYIDTSTGEIISGGSVVGGSLPTLTRNDSYTLRLRLLEKNSSGVYDDVNLSGATLKAGIGEIDALPSSGNYNLVINGITSPSIPYNATAVSVFNAVSNNVSTVSLYGSSEYGGYLLTASQPNTAMSFSGSIGTIFPSSTIIINTRRYPEQGVNAQQTIKLARNPAVFSDVFSNSSTANEITLTKTSDGGTSKNETYDLSFGALVRGGLYSLNFGGNSTTGIAPFQSAASVQLQLAAVTGIGAGNISVQENGTGGYTIQFVGSLAQVNVSTSLILDASGVNFIPLKQTTLTMNTAELADLFEESGEDTISPTLEIELTKDGNPKTIYQGTVNIRKDLITAGSSVPGSQSSYYTKADADATFVSRVGNVGFYSTTPIAKPANTSVVSALINLGLIASSVTLNEAGASYPTVALTGSAITVTDNIPFVFGSTNGTKLGTATSQKLSFYNASPVVQPTGTTVVSALINLGLVASSVTLGTPTNVVTDWSGNVSATTRTLSDSSAVTSVDWQNRVLKNSSGTTFLDWQNSTIGSGSTVVTIDNNRVSVSGSYYIEMGTTNGAFRTLSTTASLYFGSVNGNSTNSVSVTVTGSAVGDIVLIGFYSAPSSGLSFLGHTTTANGIEVDCVNATNSTINPATATYRITVLNYA